MSKIFGKKFFVLLSTAIFVVGGFLVGTGVAHAATINVPADQPTIQAAVDFASNGDTITVAAGTYAEHVAVNKSLTINGANVGVAGNATRGAESVVDGSDTDAAFAITANDVTINGFTVQNGSNGGHFSGIWSQTGTTNLSVINNVITNNDIGVWAQCGGNCLIEANLFDGNNKSGAGPSSISADSTTGLTINNNEFKNDTVGTSILLQATGVNAHNNVVVSNNKLHDNRSGVFALGISTGSFTNNDISTLGGTALSFGAGGSTNVLITNNKLHNNARGVRFEDFGYLPLAGSDSNFLVNNNSITGNTQYGLSNTSGYTGTLDATSNFWGTVSGPTNAGNVGGTGDVVNGSVNFTPWCANAACTALNDGTHVTGSPSVSASSQTVGALTLDIPAGTVITGDNTWDGIVVPPTVISNTSGITVTPDAGHSAVISLAVEVGSGVNPLTLSKSARILLAGQAGNFVGWSRGAQFTKITTVCTADDQATVDTQLGAGADCKIDVGADLVVWTKHFTTFSAYVQFALPPSGGSGGGNGGAPQVLGAQTGPTTPSTTTTTSTSGAGQVLGAETQAVVIAGCNNATVGFSTITGESCANNLVSSTSLTINPKFVFTLTLKLGAHGDEVLKLQSFLSALGYDVKSVDGKFGKVTKAALIKFQAANGLKADGVVGLKTRAYLNR